VATTPIYDPLAMGAIVQMIQESTPNVLGDVSIGLQYGVGELVTIDWQGLEYSPRWLAVRAITFLWALLPFGLAYLFFDRFDPSRYRKRGRREEEAAPVPAAVPGEAAAPPRISLAGLPAALCRPGFLRSVRAEVLLLWQTAGWLRFLLPPAAIAAALPGPAGQAGAAALLLLLAPAIAELAAREKLAGTLPLLLGQPGTPRSLVAFKLAAGFAFVLALGLPRLLSSLPHPGLALGWLCGLFFLAAFAVAAGALTGGGKLFTGLYVALWYTALNGAPFADFAAALSPAPALATSAIFAGIGLAVVAIAAAAERRTA